jgi:two-component system NtrC family sensor kinase
VLAHDGEISVESSPDAGSVFSLRFPCEPAIAFEATRSETRLQSQQYQGMRVLVVEDDDAVARVVARGLRTLLGCEVSRAEHGMAACERLTDAHFDLILSDVRMPGMNGLELLSWVRQHRPEILGRIVFMTGDPSDSPTNLAIRSAGRPMLRKPLTIEAVIDGVRGTLDGPRGRAAAQVP